MADGGRRVRRHQVRARPGVGGRGRRPQAHLAGGVHQHRRARPDAVLQPLRAARRARRAARVRDQQRAEHGLPEGARRGAVRRGPAAAGGVAFAAARAPRHRARARRVRVRHGRASRGAQA